MKKFSYYILLCAVALLSACTSRPDHAESVDKLPQIYPDYIGVTIPAGIAPMNFNLLSDECSRVYVSVKGSKGGQIESIGDYADFNVEEWHSLVEQNKGGQLTFTVMGEREGQWLQYRDFTMNVSRYALQEWGMTYRLIAISYEIFGRMGIYQRDLSNFDETEIIGNTQVPGQCVNCHTANRTNPDQYTFHVRGEHGATLVHTNGKDEWLQAKNEKLGGSMVYPYWHPQGRYIAYSTNQTGQRFHTQPGKLAEVFDTSSDLLIYDTKTHKILQDNRLKTKDWAENIPVFSPDGKYLYYTTARQQKYPQDYKKEHYNLCRIAFNAENGTFGDRVDTLFNADAIGKSVTWPRPSYDGKYLMFTLLDYGYFSVWHSESDLYLMDLATGKSRVMSEVNSDKMESLPHWNVNSHWFLFTSRRDDGVFSRIYLSSIDDKGLATKPFLLPQRNPKEYYQRLMFSYNTPDFTSKPVEADAREMGIAIESDKRVKTQK